MRSRCRWPEHPTSGSPATAAAPIPPGTHGRCLPTRRDSPGGDGGGSGRGGDGGTAHGRVIRDCRRDDASAVAGRLAAGAQPQEDQGEGDGEGDDDRPGRKAWV
jgi:hypothetical protein